ncbi:MAG: hypothetical protein P9X22_04720 [Candidatus Zapsychrus exili]|nr:hypothetical protein [Candidatus Zapsychrus exili]
MTTIKNMFHDIGNWHNKITISSSVVADMIENTDIDAVSKENLKDELNKIKESLKKIEGYAMSADKIMIPLKKCIYQSIDPDKDIEQQ